MVWGRKVPDSPYALADILGRVAHRLLVSDRKRRVIVQRFKSIKVKNKTGDRLK